MSKDVYISIVSHSQEQMVMENFSNISKSLGIFNIKISIIDNTGSPTLESFCKEREFFYYWDGRTRGFGENHNKLFSLLKPKDDDIYIVCNPDIVIQNDQLEGLLHSFLKSKCDLFNVKIYFDKETNHVDNPDKYFPGFLNFIVSFATDSRLHYGNNPNVKNPEWISGAFMVIRPKAYKKLHGFDEEYFMYCEDMDLCYRAYKLGMCIEYDGNYYIEHDTQMDSRKLFSSSMIWHMKSAVRFVVKNKRYNPLVIIR
jgi:GT2 family glycosyltransferase